MPRSPSDALARAAASARYEAWAQAAWTRAADRILSHATSSVRLLARATPVNLRAEIERLAGAWRASGPELPRFSYVASAGDGELVVSLHRVADAVERAGALGVVYAERARELADELTLAAEVGSAGFWATARRRFSRRDDFDDDADQLAAAWLAEADADPDAAVPGSAELVRSDDPSDPRSLLSRMRAEVGRRQLPLRVVVSRDLAALAAIGDGAVLVVGGRLVSRRDVERTVLHEIEGHAAPRDVATRLPLGIFAVGTARGSDDQEGRALAIEHRAGFLDVARRRELALRHAAARAVEQGADFVETMELLAAHAPDVDDRLRIVARAHRGGGLAREVVYLPALLRVEHAILEDESIDEVLGAGRVAVPAAPVLRAFVE